MWGFTYKDKRFLAVFGHKKDIMYIDPNHDLWTQNFVSVFEIRTWRFHLMVIIIRTFIVISHNYLHRAQSSRSKQSLSYSKNSLPFMGSICSVSFSSQLLTNTYAQPNIKIRIPHIIPLGTVLILPFYPFLGLPSSSFPFWPKFVMHFSPLSCDLHVQLILPFLIWAPLSGEEYKSCN